MGLCVSYEGSLAMRALLPWAAALAALFLPTVSGLTLCTAASARRSG